MLQSLSPFSFVRFTGLFCAYLESVPNLNAIYDSNIFERFGMVKEDYPICIYGIEYIRNGKYSAVDYGSHIHLAEPWRS